MPDDLMFYIVDVFAENPLEGNQLAVFLDAGHLSKKEMQKIAKEMNFSETTFILSREESKGGYDVRIFTPETEVPFAGHPTLGTAFIIQREIIKKPSDQIFLNLKIGQIPVTPIYENYGVRFLWMKQKSPEFYGSFNHIQMARAFSLKEENMDSRFPVQEVSTGIPFVIVPLRTLDSMRSAAFNQEYFLETFKDTAAMAFCLFCPETYEEKNDLNVRVFAHAYGVPEDPATGSANGCLAGYLVEHRYFDSDRIDIRTEQGYEIGRPSLLFLRAESEKDRIVVHVGGKVLAVAEGKLL